MRRRTVVAALAGGLSLAQWRLLARAQPAPEIGVPAGRAPDGVRLYRRHGVGLGTTLSIGVVHHDAAIAHRALDAGFAEIRLVERLMSLFRPDSELSRLNREGRLVRPHPALHQILSRAQAIAAATGGAFDVTVQPLWRLHAESWRRIGAPPSRREVEGARTRVGWRNLAVSPDEIVLRRRAMSITLNGVAQGYAADRVLARLRACGIRDGLVDTGELAASGARGDGRPWRIGIRDPREDAMLAVLETCDRHVATSGDYMTHFSDDLVHHHIVDPRTGFSPPELSSVTVVADSGLVADALSTALLAGGDTALRALERFSGAEALAVSKGGQVVATPGLRALLAEPRRGAPTG